MTDFDSEKKHAYGRDRLKVHLNINTYDFFSDIITAVTCLLFLFFLTRKSYLDENFKKSFATYLSLLLVIWNNKPAPGSALPFQ